MSSFNIPPGAAARLYIVDSTSRMHNMSTSMLLGPPVEGFDMFPPLGSWSFLIESSMGTKVLFDLSIPANVESSPPLIAKQLEEFQVEIKPNKDVADILRENGIEPGEVKSVVWSHHHFDHVGDIRTFPSTTELVVGPGFMDEFYPGYPTHPDSHIQESYFTNRKTREISFLEPGVVQIGSFRAHDFFGDGSFYLLDAPGHTIGHLSGLVRTTTGPDTFILMGGDMSHHSGEMRPSSLLPIPDEVVKHQAPRRSPAVCPCGAAFRQLNSHRGRQESEPFFDPIFSSDMQQASQTIRNAQAADARDDIFIVCAHDMDIVGVVDFFPKTANQWKEKGWKQKSLWRFLGDLAAAASVFDVKDTLVA
ncbi:beta-lactamase-like protein [Stachybotrys elegans]|uniref:Beta-lactamase-like protein n=1 Tax=Stachybotrys elegans TaxID=80388 RepID=A0A8K0SAM0_9HYPO|nr:beta-lactamase-like protein [Stachybotrys elegans]